MILALLVIAFAWSDFPWAPIVLTVLGGSLAILALVPVCCCAPKKEEEAEA
jgi:hypothetical protein